MQQELPLSRIARLKRFFADTDVRWSVIFNLVFIYVWGYLLWGTTQVGTVEWWLEEFGHLLWSGFHTRACLSYSRRHNAIEFEYDREREEWRAQMRVINFSVFFWEGFELAHDWSGFFTTFAQLGNIDTMADIFLSGFIGPRLIINYWRWKDGVSWLFITTRVKEANEHDLTLAYKALCRIAERAMSNEPHLMSGFRELVRKEWMENHRVRPVIKSLYNMVVRGSRHERRRRRAFLKRLKDHTM